MTAYTNNNGPRIGNVVADSNGTYGRIGYVYHDENGKVTMYDITLEDETRIRLAAEDFTVVIDTEEGAK